MQYTFKPDEYGEYCEFILKLLERKQRNDLMRVESIEFEKHWSKIKEEKGFTEDIEVIKYLEKEISIYREHMQAIAEGEAQAEAEAQAQAEHEAEMQAQAESEAEAEAYAEAEEEAEAMAAQEGQY